MSYSVLFKEFPIDRLDEIRDPVSRACGIAHVDAPVKIRRGWGFLEQNIPQEQAEALVEALHQHGIAARAIPDEQIREPEEPIVITGFESDPAGFIPTIQLTKHQTRFIPWSEVMILAAGGFAEDVIRRQAVEKSHKAATMVGIGVFLLTGLPSGLLGNRKKKEVREVRSQFVSFGQIITTRLESFFFNPEHFNFSGLGANKQLNTSLNYRTFFAEFARLSPARLNLGARLLLDRKSLALASYQRTRDFELELKWILNTILAEQLP